MGSRGLQGTGSPPITRPALGMLHPYKLLGHRKHKEASALRLIVKTAPIDSGVNLSKLITEI